MSVSAVSGASALYQAAAVKAAPAPKPQSKPVEADGDHDGTKAGQSDKLDVKG
jgi:hypothetical protein